MFREAKKHTRSLLKEGTLLLWKNSKGFQKCLHELGVNDLHDLQQKEAKNNPRILIVLNNNDENDNNNNNNNNNNSNSNDNNNNNPEIELVIENK